MVDTAKGLPEDVVSKAQQMICILNIGVTHKDLLIPVHVDVAVEENLSLGCKILGEALDTFLDGRDEIVIPSKAAIRLLPAHIVLATKLVTLTNPKSHTQESY